MSREAVVVDAVRTPIGKFRGALAGVRPDDLASFVLRALLDRTAGSADRLSEVFFGATNQAGEDNRNVARMAVLLAGLPFEVPAATVNRLCGSGMEAVIQAVKSILTGDGDVLVGGGVESMTRAPWAMAKPTEGFPRGEQKLVDTTIGWRFENPRMAERFPLEALGITAENVAERHGVSREDQDAFAVESQRKAAKAWEAGRFADEVVPVVLPLRKGGPASFDRDESPRADATVEGLAKLAGAFKPGGTVTAGNSSPLSDGAAAVLVAERRVAEAAGWSALARVAAWASAGVHPSVMGMGPVPASRRALERAGIGVGDVGLWEINEAFASQSVACVRELGIEPAKVNVHGGAIALGHPIGCSGARIVATLAHEMKRRNVRWGVATMCIGVGQGIATVLEQA